MIDGFDGTRGCSPSLVGVARYLMEVNVSAHIISCRDDTGMKRIFLVENFLCRQSSIVSINFGCTYVECVRS